VYKAKYDYNSMMQFIFVILVLNSREYLSVKWDHRGMFNSFGNKV